MEKRTAQAMMRLVWALSKVADDPTRVDSICRLAVADDDAPDQAAEDLAGQVMEALDRLSDAVEDGPGGEQVGVAVCEGLGELLWRQSDRRLWLAIEPPRGLREAADRLLERLWSPRGEDVVHEEGSCGAPVRAPL